jgi:hypothetical protein
MSIMRSSGDQAGGRRWLRLAAAAVMADFQFRGHS